MTTVSARLLPYVLAALAWVTAAPVARAADLTVVPREVAFRDAYDGRQLLVSQGPRDVSRAAQYVSSDPAVVRVDERGYLRPAGDGHASVRVSHDKAEVTVAVRVTGFATTRAIDFKTEIEPMLSRMGCNAGGCHGKASGQNGFKLSLFGFDAAFDHEAITHEALRPASLPRRPGPEFAPAQGDRAGAARRRQADERGQRGIQAGAALDRGRRPASAPNAALVTRLHVTPGDQTLKPGQEQQLAVTAEYSDGSRRDVTRQAEYFTNLDVVATVDRDGLIEARQQTGEAAIMARYMGHVAVCRALVPHGEPLASLPGFQPNNTIDELAAAKWMKLGLMPSPAGRRWHISPPRHRGPVRPAANR